MKIQTCFRSLGLALAASFFLVRNALAATAEKIPVFPSTPVDIYAIYTSLIIFWIAVIALIVIIKMKLQEIERIQKLGIDREDKDSPVLD